MPLNSTTSSTLQREFHPIQHHSHCLYQILPLELLASLLNLCQLELFVNERCLDTSTHGLCSDYYLSLYVCLWLLCACCVWLLWCTLTHIQLIYIQTHLCAQLCVIYYPPCVCPTTLSYGWLLFTHTHRLIHSLYCIEDLLPQQGGEETELISTVAPREAQREYLV